MKKTKTEQQEDNNLCNSKYSLSIYKHISYQTFNNSFKMNDSEVCRFWELEAFSPALLLQQLVSVSAKQLKDFSLKPSLALKCYRCL